MNCSKCNALLEGTESFCPSCGAFISQEEPMKPATSENTESRHSQGSEMAPPWLTSTLPADAPVNTSRPSDYMPPHQVAPTYSQKTPYEPNVIPDEIKKWNWGAFIFNIYWGIGNYSYLPLLCLIPLFNFVWMFVCGFKGNEWAWKSGKFSNVEDFLAAQETWNRAGIASFIVGLVIFVLYIFLFGFTIVAGLSDFYY